MYSQPSPYYNPPPHAPRRMNPVSAGTAFGLIAGLTVLGVGTVAAARAIERSAPPVTPGPSPAPPTGELSGVFVPGATLGGSNRIAQAIRLPIAIQLGAQGRISQSNFPLRTVAERLMIRSKEGDVVPLNDVIASPDGEVGFQIDQDTLLRMGVAVPIDDALLSSVNYADGEASGAREQILRLVCDLLPQVATEAYDAAVQAVEQQDALLDEPSGTRDAYVRSVLSKVKPDLPWPQDPDQLEAGSPAHRVWMGVDLVGQVAYQSVWNARS